MSYELEAVRDKPVGLWMLDSTIPFQEYSGSNRSGTATGTVNTALSLVNGALYSSVFNNQVVASFDAPVFQQGFEDRPFSLEAWVRPVQKTTGYTAQPYRENLVINPSFELDTSGWTENSGQPVTKDAAGQFVSGAGAKVIQVPGGTINFRMVGTAQYMIIANEGDAFSGGGWIKWIGSNAKPVQLRARFLDSNLNPIGLDQFGPAVTPTTNLFSRVTVTNAIAPAGSAYLQVWFGVSSVVAGEGFYIDSISIEKSPVLGPYFDGTLPGYEWSGAAHASVSRTRRDVSAINVVYNPNAYGNGAGGTVSGWGHGTNTGAGGISHPPTSQTDPTEGLIANFNVPAVDVKSWNVMMISMPNAAVMGLGDNLTVIFKARSNIINGNSEKLKISLVRGDGLNRVADFGTTTLTNSFKEYSITVPAIADSMQQDVVYMTIPSNTTDINMDFSYIGVFRNYSDSYFDGDSRGSLWFGAPNTTESYLLPSEGINQVLGNTGQYDGLLVDGTKMVFTTKYLNTGEARAEFDLQIPKAVHVVGVHSSNKNSLYVDGALVDEVDISDVQKADKFVVTDGKLYLGQTLSSKSVVVNAVAAYQYALSPDSVSRHFSVGRTVVGNASSVPFGGQVIPFSKDPSTILFERQWSSGNDWNSATLSGVSVDNDQLVPQIINDVSMPGYWTDSCDLYDGATPSPVNAVNMMWDGEGVIVQASVDGTTWEAVTRGQNLSCIPAGFDPTGKELYVRVTFPGGITDDTSYLDNLVVTGFNANTPNVGSFQVVYNQPAYIKESREPVAMDDSWGTEFRRGSAVISPVIGDDTIQPQTIEVWFKVLDPNVDTRFIDLRTTGDTSQPLVALQYSIPSIGGSGFTLYRNGVLNKYGATATLPSIGQWEVWHFVATGPIVNPILVNKIFSNPTQYSANVSIGQVVLYEAALSATDVSNIVSSYTGVPALRVGDASIIGVSESPSSANIYAHDWSIEASG